jgi:hypothetical protein
MPGALWQICHYKRHARGGLFHLDNLGYGHKSCDSKFDHAELIHDMHGGYWVHPRAKDDMPDARQYLSISPAYIEDRWSDHKTILLGASGDFRAWLTVNGYERRGL